MQISTEFESIDSVSETATTVTRDEQTPEPQRKDVLLKFYDLITGDEDARVCKDIPEAACRELPQNFFIHLTSSICTKIGDELASAKLILAWLVAALGAPLFLTGFLVPIRESGSLLPQLMIASALRKAARRKWFWVAGSVLEGMSVLGMAIVAATLEGVAAGWTLVAALLTVFSLSRGVRSVASKDVLGKTISKSRRGTLMGYASAIAGLAAVGVGIYAKFFHKETASTEFFVLILAAAACLWFVASGLFALLKEPEGATGGGGNAFTEAIKSIRLLRSDGVFRHFVITRALLLSTALSIPYYVVLAGERANQDTKGLGLLIIATGLAGSISAPFWGRLADRSSRLVMATAAIMAAGLGMLVFAGTAFDWSVSRSEYAFAGAFLLIGVAHSGVRLGRKTYLVDMATPEKRPAYVALSNTVIGILILMGSGFGFVSYLTSTRFTILLLAIMALVASLSALKLEEVSRD